MRRRSARANRASYLKHVYDRRQVIQLEEVIKETEQILKEHTQISYNMKGG